MKRRTILTGVGGLGLAGVTALLVRERSGTLVISDDDETTLHRPDDEAGQEPNPEQPDSPAKTDDQKREQTRIDLKFGKKAAPDRVNSNSTSIFDDVFVICNRGKKPASIWLEAKPIENENGEPAVTFHPERTYGKSLTGKQSAVKISAKTCLSVSVTTRTYGISAETTLVDRILVLTRRKD